MDTSILCVLMVVGAVCSAIGASQKHRSVAGWTIGGLLFPLIALVAIFCLPPLEKEEVA